PPEGRLTGDIYQVLAYCAGLGTRRAVLVYPGRRDTCRTYRLPRTSFRVEVRTLHVTADAEACRRSLRRLGHHLRREPACVLAASRRVCYRECDFRGSALAGCLGITGGVAPSRLLADHSPGGALFQARWSGQLRRRRSQPGPTPRAGVLTSSTTKLSGLAREPSPSPALQYRRTASHTPHAP